MASAGEGQLSRYSWLGGSATDILKTALTQPLWVMQTVLVDMRGWLYLLLLLLPLLFLPLLAPLWWLPGLADLAANLLSANPMPRGVIAYHSIALLPVLVVAAMRGACRLNAWRPGFMDAGRWPLLLITTAVLAWLCAPLPLPGMLNAWQPNNLRWLPEGTSRQLRQLIGEETSVSAQHNIGSHFSQRRMLRLFDGDPQGAEYVVLWLDTPTSALLPASPTYLATLAHHLAMVPADYLAAVRRLLVDADQTENKPLAYGIVHWQQPWLLLRRGAHSDAATLAAVTRRLDELARIWPAVEGE